MMFKDLIRKMMEVCVEDMLVKSKVAEDHIKHLGQMFDILRKYQMKLNPLKCAFGVVSEKFLRFMVNQRGIEANPEKIKALLEMSSLKKPKEVMSLVGKVAVLSRFVLWAANHCMPFFDVLKRSKKFEWTNKCEHAFQALKEHLECLPPLSKLVDGEKLYLYLTFSKDAVSAFSVKEEEKVQCPVSYVSKRLLDAETRYPELEKLALVLVIVFRKLRPYFHAYLIEVLINYPLRQVLQKPEASGRLLKWAIELGQFEVYYGSHTTIKGQTFADFIIEFTYSDTTEVANVTGNAEAAK